MTADFLPATDATSFTLQGDTEAILARLASRATVEITSNGKARGKRVVSATLAPDGHIGIIFGTWFTNPFNPALLSFDVSVSQPSTRYKSVRGAARAIAKWLGSEQ